MSDVATFTQRLDGARALVTGGSSETGPFIARALADAGADVFLTYHSDREGAEETAAYVRDRGRRAWIQRLDLLSQKSLDELVDGVRSELDRLDVLVLCAGSVGLREFRTLSREDIDTAIDGNLKGNLWLAKELGYWMKETGGVGRIVHFTAASAENTSHSAYGIGKAAQRESVRFLAFELAPEVAVNAIQPTRIDQDPDHDVAESKDNVPLGRAVHARELARMCLLLCDGAFDTVTGEVVRMDGGGHVQPSSVADL